MAIETTEFFGTEVWQRSCDGATVLWINGIAVGKKSADGEDLLDLLDQIMNSIRLLQERYIRGSIVQDGTIKS